MCGIAGYLSPKRQTTTSRVQKMVQLISHRGPDFQSVWRDPKRIVCLGHARLAIVDLDATSNQPFHSSCGQYVVVFNGEIYNYQEIRRELERIGHEFRTNSDTEVLLQSYAEYGPTCLELLDGMFAFAIWDSRKGYLFIARDRFGEKPFYYTKSDEGFVFASEIKAITRSDRKNFEIRKKFIFNFLEYGHVSNPQSTSETMYENIFKLPKATYKIIDSNGSELVSKKYWNPIQNVVKGISIEEASSRFYKLFEESVRLRLGADVEVGSSLSGGLDSSAIVATISQVMKPRQNNQKVFTARFKDYSKDEGHLVEEMLRSYPGLTSRQVYPNASDLSSEIDQLVHHQEEPFPTTSILAQYKVMQLVQKSGVKVLLDGQGADEYLGGYESHHKRYLKELFDCSDSSYSSALAAYNEKYGVNFKGYTKPGFISSLSHFKARFLSFFNTNLSNPVVSDCFRSNISKEEAYRFTPSNRLNHLLYLSYTEGWGLENLLRYADRNAMAFSIETRMPFLSHKLVEYVQSLPPGYKINKVWSKFVLRKSVENLVPNSIVWNINKVGFETPEPVWFEQLFKTLDYKRALEKMTDLRIVDSDEFDSRVRWRMYIMAKYL